MESDHGGRDGGKAAKPCRACPLSNPDFKSFMKTGPATPEKAKKPSKTPKVPPKPCPPDVDEIGRGSWTLLHTMSAYLPEDKLSEQQKSDVVNFMNIFSRIYPCTHCADDLKVDLVEAPPNKVETGKEFAQWMCQLHNKVNVKLGKPTFDCSKVYERWRDGYPDGSCD